MTAPTKIGKYEIRRQIGRGAMGVVYEGFDPVIERRVAIKTLRLELFESSQVADVRARFKREAQAAGQLAHPHIVTVHDYGEHEGTPFIVMEFLAGNELSHILARGSHLPLSEIVRLMTQLLGALSYAHERKLVHRDIKPANIFVLDDGSLKVVDFGIAHVEASNLTDTGALLGTPAYMSPEQFLALPVDERSDIFSAGVILYELLTGDKPFTGSVTTIMQKVLRQEPIEPSVLNPMLSAVWDTVVKRAMAKKPEARFHSARQFAETIKQVFDRGAVKVSVDVSIANGNVSDQWGETLRPSAHKQQASPKQQSVQLASARPENLPVKISSKRKSLGIAAFAVVVAVGAATFYMSQRPRDELVKNGSESKAKYSNFDVAGARKSGASDEDIVAFLAKKFAFDVAAARKAGYSNIEIISHLSGLKSPNVDESAKNQVASERAVTDKAAADAKVAEAKAAQETKLARERASLEKAAESKKAAEKLQTEKMSAEKATKVTEKEVKEKVASEVARLESLRVEKVNADRLAAEKAAERATSDKPSVPKIDTSGTNEPNMARQIQDFRRIQDFLNSLRATSSANISAKCKVTLESGTADCIRGGNDCRPIYNEVVEVCPVTKRQECFGAIANLRLACESSDGCTYKGGEVGKWCTR